MSVGKADGISVKRYQLMKQGTVSAMRRPKEAGPREASDAAASHPKREKTSFSLSTDAKYRLTSLKADLRRRGHSVTESSILETLILGAEPSETFLRALSKEAARRKTQER
jgi:hypothetical protein